MDRIINRSFSNLVPRSTNKTEAYSARPRPRPRPRHQGSRPRPRQWKLRLEAASGRGSTSRHHITDWHFIYFHCRAYVHNNTEEEFKTFYPHLIFYMWAPYCHVCKLSAFYCTLNTQYRIVSNRIVSSKCVRKKVCLLFDFDVIPQVLSLQGTMIVNNRLWRSYSVVDTCSLTPSWIGAVYLIFDPSCSRENFMMI